MTVQLTSLADPTAQLPGGDEAVTETLLGVDLTMLGVTLDESAFTSGYYDFPDYADLSMLASCLNAACAGGLDIVSLRREFKARGDLLTSDMDALRTLAKLTSKGAIGYSAGIPDTSEAFLEAIECLSKQRDGWGRVEVEVGPECDLALLRERTELAHTSGIHVCARIHEAEVNHLDLQALTTFIDSIHYTTADPYQARELRLKIRSFTSNLERKIPVLVDLGVVISGSVQAAYERALLIEGMNGAKVFPHIAHVIGTVYDVADTVEKWIGLGAADGVIFVPASLPTDLASLIRGVVPLLQARELAEDYQD